MHDDPEQVSSLAQRLRELPTAVPPPYGWHEFRRRAQGTEAVVVPRFGWHLAGIAASVLVLVAGVAAYERSVHSHASQGAVAAAGRADARKTQVSDGAGDVRAPAGDDAAVAAGKTRELESWMSTLPQPALVKVGTRSAVAKLEDRIAQVDDLMNTVRAEDIGEARFASLQRERLSLVGSLAQVRYAEMVASSNP